MPNDDDNDDDLPGSAVPLPEPMQDAIAEFDDPDNKYRLLRAAALQVLYEDLVADVRKMLKSRGRSV